MATNVTVGILIVASIDALAIPETRFTIRLSSQWFALVMETEALKTRTSPFSKGLVSLRSTKEDTISIVTPREVF